MKNQVMNIKSRSAIRIKEVLRVAIMTIGVLFLVAGVVMAYREIANNPSSSLVRSTSQVPGIPQAAKRLPPSLLATVPANIVTCLPADIPEFDIAQPTIAGDAARIKTLGLDVVSQSIAWKQSRFSSLQAREKLIHAAQQRKDYYLAIMKTDPTTALQTRITDLERSTLSGLTVNCVEMPVVIEGKIGRINADYFDQQHSVESLILTSANSKLHLHLPQNVIMPNIGASDMVRVTGYRLDNEILATAVTKVESAKQITPQSTMPQIMPVDDPLGGGPSGEVRMLVIMVNFTDQYQLSIGPDQVSDVVFNRVNNYYKENSYNKIFLSGSVIGPLDLSMESTCDDLDGVIETTLAAAKANDPSLSSSSYDIVSILGNYGNCGWSGLAVGGWPIPTTIGPVNEFQFIQTWISEDQWYYGQFIVAHETGHNLFNGHATFLDCTNVSQITSIDPLCNSQEYGDAYDVMGGRGRFGMGHFNAFQKLRSGWLDEGTTLKTITAGGRYVIEPIETSPNKIAPIGIKALRISRERIPYHQQTDIYIEYRQPIGFDSSISFGDVYEGALIHVGDAIMINENTQLVDTSPPSNAYSTVVHPGASFIDPGSCRNPADLNTCLKITVVSKTPSALTVDIVLGVEYIAPTVAITQPSNLSAVGGVAQISATATDNVGIQKVEFYVDGVKKSSQSALTCNPPTSCAATYRWDTRAVNGGHVLSAKVYDLSGNVAESVPINIQVSNGKQWIPVDPSPVPAT